MAIRKALETMIVQGDQDKKFSTTYEYATVSPQHVVFQNRTDNGRVSEQVDIDAVTGFYTHYTPALPPTARDEKDIPLGQPFAAYFGWCDINGNAINPAPVAAPVDLPPANVSYAAPTTAAPAPGVAPTTAAPAPGMTPGILPGASVPGPIVPVAPTPGAAPAPGAATPGAAPATSR